VKAPGDSLRRDVLLAVVDVTFLPVEVSFAGTSSRHDQADLLFTLPPEDPDATYWLTSGIA
jgi:hypothetical protein